MVWLYFHGFMVSKNDVSVAAVVNLPMATLPLLSVVQPCVGPGVRCQPGSAGSSGGTEADGAAVAIPVVICSGDYGPGE